MKKRINCLSICLALLGTLLLAPAAAVSEVDTQLSQSAMSIVVTSEIETILAGGTVADNQTWIPLKDMSGTDYAYFVPLLGQDGILAGYSVVSFAGGNIRTLVSTSGENAAFQASYILKTADTADEIIYEFPEAFIAKINNSYFKICLTGELEKIADTADYVSSTVSFLTENAPLQLSTRATTVYGSLTNWDMFDFVPVSESTGYYYGGYQGWLTDEAVSQFWADRSCGVTAASNMLQYMSDNVSGMADLYTQSGMTKANFSAFQKDVYDYLPPAIWGIPTIDTMISGVTSFATAQGVDLTETRSPSTWNEANVRTYIAEGLNKESPVLLLTWNSPIPELQVHWVTVTRIYDSGAGTKMITSNWAEKKVYDFSTWVNGSSIYQGVIYFE